MADQGGTSNHTNAQESVAGPRDGRTQESPPVQRRRRRWLRVLFVVGLVGFAAFVAAAPRIVSLPAVRPYALSIVNSRIPGTIQVESASLSWLGPTQVQGLRVLDAESRDVLDVAEVSSAAGVWGLITSGQSFGEVIIREPSVTLYINEKNEISLVKAFEEDDGEAKETEAGGTPAPRGTIKLADARVVVVREGGASYEIPQIAGEVALDTLASISGSVSARMADGSQVDGKIELKGLMDSGGIALDMARGTVALATKGDVDLGPPCAVVLPKQEIRGKTGFRLDATFDAGNIQGDYSISVSGLESAGNADGAVRPINLSVRGQALMSDGLLVANTNLEGEAGTASADIEYRPSEKPLDLSFEQIASAVLTGDSIALPDLTLNAQASVDLAALDRAVPGLLNVREGQRIAAGRFEVSGLAIRGSAAPTAGGEIRLSDVVAEGRSGRVTLQPITLAVESSLDAGKGLNVRKARLTSSFATVEASGSPADVRAEIDADLTGLRQELGRVFDFGRMELAGRMKGLLTLARTDDRINVQFDAGAEAVEYASGEVRLDLPRATVRNKGYVQLRDDKVERYVAEKVEADLNGEVLAGGTGWYQFDTRGFDADINLSQANLSFFANRLAAPGTTELRRYSGALASQIKAARAGAADPIRVEGNMIARGIGVDGSSLTSSDATLQVSGATVSGSFEDVQLARVKLESDLAAVSASDMRIRLNGGLQFEGNVQGASDLSRLATALARVAKLKEPPRIAGRLTMQSTATSANRRVQFAGTGGIESLEVGVGEKAHREERVTFEFDTGIDSAADSVDVRFVRLASRPLRAEISGRIDQYQNACMLALSGQYEASWRELTTVIHTLAPGTREVLSVEGTSASPIRLSGPARAPGARPPFKGVRGGLDVTWQSATVLGEKLSPATLAPELEDGRINVPESQFAVDGGGTVRLGGVVDFAGDDPTLRVADRLNVLQDVVVTRELAANLLSRINPIFMYMNKVEGRASLAVQDIVFPFGESLKSQGNGAGRLDLIDFKVEPSGIMSELLVLGGQPRDQQLAVLVSGLDFVIQEGRIVYKDFTLTFPPDFDIKFYGSVGLDETVDLVVSLPVRAELLERIGVKGPIVEYTELLAGSRIDIPMVGTRENPKLDLSRVDPKPLIDRAIQGLARKKAGELLGGAGEKGDRKADVPPKPDSDRKPGLIPGLGGRDDKKLKDTPSREPKKKGKTGRVIGGDDKKK